MEIEGVDALQLYLGVERYGVIENDTEEIKGSINTYFLEYYLKGEKAKRFFYYNPKTNEELCVDQNGKVLNFKSNKRENVYELVEIKSLQEIVTQILYNFENKYGGIPASLSDFVELRDYMIESSNENMPALIGENTLCYIIEKPNDLYSLAFGNPLIKLQKTNELIRTNNNNNKD